MILKDGNVFLEGRFVKCDLRISGDTVVQMGEHLSSIEDEESVDMSGRLVVPGLIDIHTHGCAGYDFTTAENDGITKMCRQYLKSGVTSILATTITSEPECFEGALTRINAFKAEQESGKGGSDTSRIQGIHMEGPLLGKAKKGAHDERYLQTPSDETYERWQCLSGNNVRITSIDPTLPGAVEFIERHHKEGMIFSMAHTECDYAQAERAIAAGATNITHLFNAMNGLHHREPGLIGAFSDFPVYGELICDGIHVLPPVIRLMFKLSPERLVLISDSLSATGLQDGDYELGGLKVIVKEGKACLENGTIAGSTINVLTAVQRAAAFGIPKEAAIRSATELPAKAAGLSDSCGILKQGRKADLLVMSEGLELLRVMLGGSWIK